MKIFLKFIFTTLAIWLIGGIGVFIFAMKKLPDPRELKNITKQVNDNATLLNQQTTMEEAFKLKDSTTPETTAESAAPVEKKEISQDVFKALLTEEFSDIRVCENLGNPSAPLDTQMMMMSIMDLKRADPSVESFRISMKYVFQSEPVRELLTEIDSLKDLPASEKEKYLEKSNFYYKASLKVIDFYRHKKEYEDMADRAFHLYVINQMIVKKPELKNENHIFSFCKSLQSSIGSKNNSDVDIERAAVLKLIEYYGLTPKELGFNPAVKTKINFEVKNKAVSFGFQHPGINL